MNNEPYIMENSENQSITHTEIPSIPNSLMSKLAEFSHGAFIIVSLDSNGEPVINKRAENSVSELAIESHARMYLKQRKLLREEAMTAKALNGIDFGEII